MARELEKVSKAELVEELALKHDAVVSESKVKDDEPVSVADLTKSEIIAEFGGLLDTMTEQERVDAAAARVEAENESAPAAEDVAMLYQPPTVEPITGGEEGYRITQWSVDADTGMPAKQEQVIIPEVEALPRADLERQIKLRFVRGDIEVDEMEAQLDALPEDDDS